MSSFRTEVSDMEERQSQQRGVAQCSLRNEMTSLQKRIMQQAVGHFIHLLDHFKFFLPSLSLSAQVSGVKDEASPASYADETVTSNDITSL